MFHDLSPEMAGLVGNWCNTLLYGITVVVYGVCTYILIKRRGDRSATATCILIGTSTVQFVLATVFVAMGLRLLIEGFIHTENVPNATFLYWINPTIKTQVVAKAIYFTNTLVADCILVWRVYMVWGKNFYVCILPIITTCCCMGTGYLCVSKYGKITGDLTPTSLFKILNLMIYTWSLSMATQLFSTAMIAGKLWWHAKRNPFSKSRYVFVIAIIVESGAIFTLSSAFLLVLAVFKTQAGEVLGDIATQIAAIVPTLMIIQFELIRSKKLDTLRNADLTGKKQALVKQPTGYGHGHRHGEPAVQVTVSTLALSETDSERELKCEV